MFLLDGVHHIFTANNHKVSEGYCFNKIAQKTRDNSRMWLQKWKFINFLHAKS